MLFSPSQAEADPDISIFKVVIAIENGNDMQFYAFDIKGDIAL